MVAQSLLSLTAGASGNHSTSRLWRYSFVILVLSLFAASTVSAVPKRVANRMIPSWWFITRNICYNADDCKADECCTRPMMSLNSYCMPRRTRGQVCNSAPFLLNEKDGVYFNDCPCLAEFSCAQINKDVNPSCVDLHELEVDFQRFVNMKTVSNFIHRGIPAARKSKDALIGLK
ncbi:uncharacterized protein [Macrobrachium rosenbergii]|uniref:uncharacterized protein n=1 Tax=Macrobrachium rosenbergii TaxID=79674 RepID=UPI0034D5FB02